MGGIGANPAPPSHPFRKRHRVAEFFQQPPCKKSENQAPTAATAAMRAATSPLVSLALVGLLSATGGTGAGLGVMLAQGQ